MVNGWQKIPWIFDLAVVLESLSIGMPVFGYQDSEVFFNWHPYLNESKWTYLFLISISIDWRDIGIYNNHRPTKACATLSFGQAIATTSQVSCCPLPLKKQAQRLQGHKTDNFLRPRPVHKIGGPATSSPIIWYSSRFCQYFSWFPSKMGKSSCDSSQLWLKMIDPSLFFYSSIRCSIRFSAISGASPLNFVYLWYKNPATWLYLGTCWHSRVTRVTDQGDQNQQSWNVGPQKSHL